MVDLATLALRVDASGMTQGERALERLAAKGASTEANVEKSMSEIGRSAQSAGAKMHGGASHAVAGLGRLEVASSKAAGGVRNLGPAFVNAGFQVQDFAVQVASGQSVMIAFAQQAPQLLGVLGFSGKLAMIGAGLGTLVAVGAAVAPMLFDMGNKAKSAEDAIDDLSSAVSRYKEYTQTAAASSVDLRDRFGALGGSASKLSSLMAELTRIEGAEKAESAILKVFDAYGKFSREKMVWSNDGLFGSIGLSAMGSLAQISEFDKGVEKLRGSFDLTKQEAESLASGLSNVVNAADVSGQMSALVDLNSAFISTFGSLERVPKEMRDIAMQAGLAAIAFGEIVDPAERARIAAKAQSEALTDIVSKYDQQVAMSRALAQHGERSAQVEALKREEALRAAEALIQQGGHAGSAAEKIRASAMAAFDAAQGADAAARALAVAEGNARALASAMAAAAGMTVGLKQQIAVLDAQISAAQSKQDVAAAGRVASLQMEARARLDAALAAAGGSRDVREEAEREYAAQLALIGAIETKTGALAAQVKVNSDAAKAGKSAAKEAERLAKQLDKETDKWRASLSPMEKYRSEMEKLQRVQGLLTADEYARAVEQIGLEFANATPMIGQMSDAVAGFVTGSIRSFGDLLGSFRDTIRQMVATAIANPIKLGISSALFGTSAAASGSAAGGGAAAGAGLLGGLGTFGSALWGGAKGAGSAFLSGGLGGLAGNIGGTLSGATSSLAGLGSAIGAIAAPIAAVGAIMSFFSKKTKELDRGLRVTVSGVDALVEQFSTLETKRFWGLSKKTGTHYRAADGETSGAIGHVVGELQAGIHAAAAVLDFGADTFKGFAHTLKISTKGMSEDEALDAVQEAVLGLGDAYADLVPGLRDQIAYGEGAAAALERLSTSLTAVRGVADLLGHRFDVAGIAGGALASHLSDAFGGLDAMGAAVQSYWGAVYTEQERLETTTRQAAAALADLGLAMPKSRAEYRAMVEALDLTNAGTHEAYAALLGLAGVMDQILPSVSGLTAALATLQGNVSTGLEASISAANAAAQANAKAAGDWYKASGSIRDWIAKMQGTASALTDPMRARANNEAAYQSTLARALAGDLAAAGEATGAADRLLASVRATARSQSEAAVSEARILSDMGLLAGVGDIEGARHDVIAGLLGQQSDVLAETRDYIAAGNALTAEMIATLEGQLGGLDDAIAAAQLINYAYLKERLAVTVDVLADADVPEYLRKLLGNAATGVTGYVDFLVRSDLTPDLKWLAMTGASEHVKTVEYLAKNQMGRDLTTLALSTVSGLQKTVNLIVGQRLDADTLRIALAGNSELSRTVNATLAANIGADAKRLALGNVGAYAVAVQAAFAPNISPDVRRLVLTQQGDYAAMIGAAINSDMSAEARRILLTQQGGYVANITGVLVSNMTEATRALLLNANTQAARAVTISAAFAKSLTADERQALSSAATTTNKTIRAMIDASGLSATGALYLAQLGLGSATVQKTVASKIALSALSGDQRLLLSSITETVQKSASLKASGLLTADQRAMLSASAGSVSRALGLTATGSLTADQKSILGAQSATITRTIKGAVELGSLTGQQRALLEGITGANAGKLTLGGSFQFDPTTGFKSWFESSTKAAISSPMDALRTAMGPLQTALDALRKGLEDEGKRQALGAYASQLAGDGKGGFVATRAQLQEMGGILGLNTNGSNASLLSGIAGYSNTDAINKLGLYDDAMRQRMIGLTSDPRLRVNPEAYLRARKDVAASPEWANDPQGHWEAYGRAEMAKNSSWFARNLFDWSSVGGIPGFASGGTHLGGLRIVGENGPELEATGPSRIYSASQTRSMLNGGGNAELVAELKALRQELADLKSISAKGNEHSRDMAKILRRVDALGIKLDEDQNSVKVET